MWEAKFTLKAHWGEIQKSIRRHGWAHVDSVIVGSYGDKSWAEWIMSRAEGGEQIGDCGNVGHKDEAMKYITGQNPAGTNWGVEPYWLQWWSTNKQKSQLEWIREGLKQHGVSVQTPAVPGDFGPLLALLGSTSTNEFEKVPEFIRYNAFRWLRDSDFEVVPYALSNVTSQTSENVRNGLVKYWKYERVYPKYDGAGKLDFAPDAGSRPRPAVSNNPIRFAVYVFIISSFAIGVALIRRSFQIDRPEKMEHLEKPQSSL